METLVGAIRVEELARRADVSVDTIRFYQKRRLLPPPRREGRVAWYDAAHEDRLGRIKELQRQGFSLAVIRRLLDGELDASDATLAAAVAGAQQGDAALLDTEELAQRVGIPVPLVEAVVREGLLVPQARDGRSGYTADDVEVLRSGLRLLEAGLPLNDLLALARRHHEATRAIASDAVEMFDTYVRHPLQTADLSDDEKAERLVDAFGTLLPTVTALVAHHFRSVLLEIAQEHLEAVGDATELAAARNEPGWEPA
jgi:DNA-binding transcriptional MerR regulator